MREKSKESNGLKTNVEYTLLPVVRKMIKAIKHTAAGDDEGLRRMDRYGSKVVGVCFKLVHPLQSVVIVNSYVHIILRFNVTCYIM